MGEEFARFLLPTTVSTSERNGNKLPPLTFNRYEGLISIFVCFRCHGEKGNIVFDLVKDHKVLDISDISYPNVNFFRSTGQLLDNEKCGRLMALCLLILENSEKDLEDCKGSLGGYVVAKYEEALKTPEYADIDSDTSQQVLEYFHKFENSIEASDSWFETSGNGYLQYWECEGHPLLNWKDKGYKTVIDFITVSTHQCSLSSGLIQAALFRKSYLILQLLLTLRARFC